MSRSSPGRANRRRARAARARERRAAELLGPLTPAQMVEAEGYLVEALEAQLEQFVAELGRMRADLADTPAGPRRAALEARLTDTAQAHLELTLMLDAVRARRRFDVPGGLGVAVIRARRHELLESAAERGEPVDEAALADVIRREQMIAIWLMDYEAAQ